MRPVDECVIYAANVILGQEAHKRFGYGWRPDMNRDQLAEVFVEVRLQAAKRTMPVFKIGPDDLIETIFDPLKVIGDQINAFWAVSLDRPDLALQGVCAMHEVYMKSAPPFDGAVSHTPGGKPE